MSAASAEADSAIWKLLVKSTPPPILTTSTAPRFIPAEAPRICWVFTPATRIVPLLVIPLLKAELRDPAEPPMRDSTAPAEMTSAAVAAAESMSTAPTLWLPPTVTVTPPLLASKTAESPSPGTLAPPAPPLLVLQTFVSLKPPDNIAKRLAMAYPFPVVSNVGYTP